MKFDAKNIGFALLTVALFVIIYIVATFALTNIKNNAVIAQVNSEIPKEGYGCRTTPFRLPDGRYVESIVENENMNRYGNKNLLTVFDDTEYVQSRSRFMIKLIYNASCKKHPLVPLYWHLKDEYENNNMSGQDDERSRIYFTAEECEGASGPLPMLLKYTPDGRISEYKGHYDFGPLVDWVRDDTIHYESVPY